MTLEELSHNNNNYYLLLLYVLVLPTDFNIESMLQVVYYFMKDISMSDFCFGLMMSCFSIMHLPTPTPVATMTYIRTPGYGFSVRGVLSPAWLLLLFVCLFCDVCTC